MTTDPGAVPKDARPLPTDDQEYDPEVVDRYLCSSIVTMPSNRDVSVWNLLRFWSSVRISIKNTARDVAHLSRRELTIVAYVKGVL